jgi:hypothetical protein
MSEFLYSNSAYLWILNLFNFPISPKNEPIILSFPKMVSKSEVKVGLPSPPSCELHVCAWRYLLTLIPLSTPPPPAPHQKKLGQNWIMPAPDSVIHLALKT